MWAVAECKDANKEQRLTIDVASYTTSGAHNFNYAGLNPASPHN